MEHKDIPNTILPTAGVRRNIAADGGAGPPPGGHHDNGTLNPGIVPGRVLSDHITPSNALMRCRRPVVMGTFNACTAREEARLIELAHCAEERGVEILGVQEHRRVHTEDPILYHRVERCTFISASAWKNDSQAATGGVGLMLGPRAHKALHRVYHHTDRIMCTEFSGNPVTTVIVVYSPTNVAPSDKVEKFFEDLVRAVRGVPTHNFLAILGDFNARLGPEDVPFPYHDSTNRNGTYLTAFLTEHELLAANTIFRKRTGKRWTFRDRASGMLRQLDYILVRKKWRNSIMNAEPYSTFSSVGSDHRVVSMRVRLSLRAPKPSPKIRYNWKAFSSDPGLLTRYTEEVRRRFQQLDRGAEASSEYRRFVTVNEEATRLCVPKMEKVRTSLRSKHPEVIAARGMVEEGRLNFEREPTEERRSELNEAKQFLFRTYDTIKGEELMERVRRVQAAHGEQRYGEAWRVINEMTGRKRTKEGQVKGHSPEERVAT
ncbi:craniofacial development protein 2-like [Rhinichthys klamathensis goyatoka]|uniref:craniofacial development protein 2-like n=1 Tax=Rhinichthys klamathensis goyatoka TaxID=3034132 RepID=UPI0024B59930|nr:craniofacial development protein 2-like [Rhinichthys klamathensis goyatoka]